MKLIYVSLLLQVFYFSINLISEDNYFFYPKNKEVGNYCQNISIGIVILPRNIFEDAISQIPVINYHARYDLSDAFRLHANFSTIIFSNNFNIGLAWNYKYDNFNVGLFSDIGLWFGFYNSEGISVSSRGWTFYPGIILAYPLNKVKLTLKFHLLYQSQGTFAGTNQIGKTFNGYTGYAISLTSEQKVINDLFFTLEAKFNFTKFHNITWLSYSTFDTLILYPELTFGFNL